MANKELLAHAINKLGAYNFTKKLSLEEIMAFDINELRRHYNRRVESVRGKHKWKIRK